MPCFPNVNFTSIFSGTEVSKTPWPEFRERHPLVDEVSADILHIEGSTRSAGWISSAVFSAF
jgi:hypothetical protein